ncbi:MAG: anaerobic ribonucleoside-triphosphate reductase activating protein [Clostridiales bacterium]|jgi:anaerobic ribonucleoside-triphosphate reductase activating protein|nr:anaerobic ribonucleoside-triphosphate reductase activating protein [Clostridiales bacterium]
MEVRIAGTVNDSIVDGPGLRFVIFTQGCPHNCEGCHNPQTHAFDAGEVVSIGELYDMIKKNPLLDGVTFSGGEPFCQAIPLAELGRKIHEIGLNIITYTGYTLEYLLENADESNGYLELLNVTDYLIDGKFEIENKNYLLKFRGSSNQRYIDCKKSLETGNICIVDD